MTITLSEAAARHVQKSLVKRGQGVGLRLAVKTSGCSGLAYALEFAEGIAFSTGGLSDPDEPALTVRDLTGALRVWIEIGSPDAARLHKASKAAPRVVVYAHKGVERLAGRLAGERIHRAQELELYAIDPTFLTALTSRLNRRMAFALSVSDRELFVSIGAETLVGRVTRWPIT